MSSIVNVTGCGNCPFRVDEYDDWAASYSFYTYCNLAKFKNLPEDGLLAWDGEDNPSIPPPDWCPLGCHKTPKTISL